MVFLLAGTVQFVSLELELERMWAGSFFTVCSVMFYPPDQVWAVLQDRFLA